MKSLVWVKWAVLIPIGINIYIYYISIWCHFTWRINGISLDLTDLYDHCVLLERIFFFLLLSIILLIAKMLLLIEIFCIYCDTESFNKCLQKISILQLKLLCSMRQRTNTQMKWQKKKNRKIIKNSFSKKEKKIGCARWFCVLRWPFYSQNHDNHFTRALKHNTKIIIIFIRNLISTQIDRESFSACEL